MSLRVCISAAVSTVLVALTLGCSQDLGLEEEPTGEDSAVTVGITNEPRSLDPGIDLIRSSVAIARTVVEPLLETDDEFAVVPGLATDWEQVGPKQWRFTLREGVEFSNGETFNADAAAKSILANRDNEAGALASYFSIIESAEASDEYVLDVKTREPSSEVPALMTLQFMYPPEYFSEVGPEGFGRAPVGTGPFVFTSWTPGVSIEVERNEDYWGDAPAVSTLEFVNYPEDAARVSALRTGEIDLALNVPPQLVGQVESTEGARIDTAPGLRKFFIEFDPDSQPTSNVKLRRAIAHAINPDVLVEGVLEGRGEIDPNVFYKGLPSAGGHGDSYLSYDPDRARQLISELGDIGPIDFYSTSGRYILDTEVAEAIAGMLEEVGLTIKRHPLEIGAYQELAEADNMPGINMRSTGMVYPHENAVMGTHFRKNSLYKNCNNEELTAMADKAAAIMDEEERTVAYNDIEAYILTDFVCWAPTYVQLETVGVGPGIKDLKHRFGEDVEFKSIVPAS